MAKKERRVPHLRKPHQKSRKVEKTNADESKATLLERARKIAGKPNECRRLTQYRKAHTGWILSVGTCPISSGDRAPISQKISHVLVLSTTGRSIPGVIDAPGTIDGRIGISPHTAFVIPPMAFLLISPAPVAYMGKK